MSGECARLFGWANSKKSTDIRKTFHFVILFHIFPIGWTGSYCNWLKKKKAEHFFKINCHPIQVELKGPLCYVHTDLMNRRFQLERKLYATFECSSFKWNSTEFHWNKCNFNMKKKTHAHWMHTIWDMRRKVSFTNVRITYFPLVSTLWYALFLSLRVCVNLYIGNFWNFWG